MALFLYKPYCYKNGCDICYLTLENKITVCPKCGNSYDLIYKLCPICHTCPFCKRIGKKYYKPN